MKKLWAIILPRFRCPFCGATIENLRFKGRLQTQRPKKGKIIERVDSDMDVDEQALQK
jgi:hypothetical protein